MVKRRTSKTLDPKAVFEADIQLKTNSMKELEMCLTGLIRAYNRITSADDVCKTLQHQENDRRLVRRYARLLTPPDVVEALIVRRLQLQGMSVEMRDGKAIQSLRKLRTRIRHDRQRTKEWVLEIFGRW